MSATAVQARASTAMSPTMPKASSIWARDTSRWVTARNCVSPHTEKRSPQSSVRSANPSAVKPSPATSKYTMFVSTGSTARMIADAGVPVVEVASVTGFPECLDGRVKTLHPAVHAGLLADVRREDHRTQLHDLGIAAFELLVVNLYPFVATVASGAGPQECVEQIDIGGPAMIRAAVICADFRPEAIMSGPGARGARPSRERREHP